MLNLVFSAISDMDQAELPPLRALCQGHSVAQPPQCVVVSAHQRATLTTCQTARLLAASKLALQSF